MSEEIQWGALLRAGLHGLRLRPGEFWALTPVELQLMLGVASGDRGPMLRAGLAALMAAYPDKGGGARAVAETEREERRDDGCL